jgi:DNA-binding transcriptional regulator YiaG
MKSKNIPFDVVIPNLEGDGIAEKIRITVQAYTDPETGEDVLTPASMELIEKTQARHMGLLAPEEIRALRERLMLTQEEMSELLQLGGKSYTRWESGRARPSRSLNILLCALRDGVITVEYLRALRHGGTTGVFAQRLLEPEQWDKSHAWVYFESPDDAQCWSEASIGLESGSGPGKSARFRLLMKRLTRSSNAAHPRHTAIIPDRLPGAQRRWTWEPSEVEEKVIS